ncbi:MAG: hypothetical protein A2V66_17015 [Ignavibacteria bacterium RBG_13_36_8]|nr:MAG: hypothetical protein A2V66_17015 [Ignavibacteria bacterium RBG_13_36_8]
MKFFLILLIFNAILFAQDTTVSQAFKPSKFLSAAPLIKVKYPSYPLRAGFALIKEANEGDPFAQHELGLRYILKQGFPADTAKGILWIKCAVDQGIPVAKYNYGILLNNGIGIEWDPFEAYKNFKAAAEFGMPESEFVFGLYFTDNFVVNRNLSEAYKWIKKSSDSGYEPAKEALKQFDRMGINAGKENENKDKSTKTSAKNLGLSESSILMEQEWELDFYEFEGDKSVVTSEDEKVKEIFAKNQKELKSLLGITQILDPNFRDTSGVGLIRFAAESGSPEALLFLGRGHEKGIIVKKDIILAAVNYLRAFRLGSSKAAEQLIKLIRSENFFDQMKNRIDSGDTDAMYVWAGLVAIGFDFQLSEKQAFDLLVNASAKDNVYSLIEIGLCYYSGKLVEQDKQKALVYWNIASGKGSKEAAVRIALANLIESNTDSNLNDNLSILNTASNQGSVLAQTALGYCYEKGIGVVKNKAVAARFYRYASQRGSETAYYSLKRMYDEIRPDGDEFRIYEE